MGTDETTARLSEGGERPFVGRRAEIDGFVDFVRDGRHRVLELVGVSGMGKTALLRRFATVASDFASVAAVDAGAGQPVEHVLASWRANLGPRPSKRALERSFSEFDELVEEHVAVDDVLSRAGGATSIFDAVGEVRDPTGLAPLLAGLGAAVSERVRARLHSRVALDVYLRGVEGRITAAFVEAIGDWTSRSGKPVVLMIDTYEQAALLDEWVCGSLVESLPGSVRLVLSGRNQLRRMNSDWTEHSTRIRPLPLAELEAPDAVMLLQRFGLTDAAQAQAIAEATGGWPLLLILVRQLAIDAGGWEHVGRLDLARDRDELATQLLDQIMREDRAQPLRDLLERAAVAPWLDPQMIASLLEVSPSTAQDLYDRLAVHAFAERDPHGLRLHERLAEMLRERLRYRDPQELAAITSRLDAHLRQRSDRLLRADPTG